MNTIEFLKAFGAYRVERNELQEAELNAERQANNIEFIREAADIEECDPVGVFPHIHEPHQSKVDSYHISAVAALILGLAVAKKISEQAAVTSIADQLLGGSQTSWTVGALTIVAFIGIGKILEAHFHGIERLRFLSSAPKWYGWSVFFVAASGSALLIARVATPELAAVLEIIEPYAWLALELSLLMTCAIAWVGKDRFAWSKRFVDEDNRIMSAIAAARRRLAATAGVPIEDITVLRRSKSNGMNLEQQ